MVAGRAERSFFHFRVNGGGRPPLATHARARKHTTSARLCAAPLPADTMADLCRV